MIMLWVYSLNSSKTRDFLFLGNAFTLMTSSLSTLSISGATEKGGHWPLTPLPPCKILTPNWGGYSLPLGDSWKFGSKMKFLPEHLRFLKLLLKHCLAIPSFNLILFLGFLSFWVSMEWCVLVKSLDSKGIRSRFLRKKGRPSSL